MSETPASGVVTPPAVTPPAVTPPAAETPPTATPPAAPEILLGAEPTPVEPTPFNIESFTFPEGLEVRDEHKTFLTETAKKHNLTNEAVNDLVGWHATEVQALSDRVQGLVEDAWNETLTGWKTETEAKFGAALPEVLTKCERVIGEFGGPEFLQVLRTTGLGNNPVMIGMLAKIADAMGEVRPTTPGGDPKAEHPLAAMYPSMVKTPKEA